MPDKKTKPTSAVVKQFQGIPMSELIGGPLQAACDAQLNLASASFEYINKIGFSEDGKTTRLVEFDVDRSVETDDGFKKDPVHVQAPLLGLVPVPSLLIEDVNVSFQMEVTATESTESKVASENSINASSSFKIPFIGKGSVSVQGKVTTSRDNTRSTNQTAKYQVSVNARHQLPTEGMSRLMDIMASCTGIVGSKTTGSDTAKTEENK